MQAIIDACKQKTLRSRPSLIISNNSKSGAVERAKQVNMPFLHISSAANPDQNDFASMILSNLEKYGIDLIVLAGYMKMTTPNHHRKESNEKNENFS
jgi:phosphoribosylglycinamide formyltransferase 1